MHDWEHPYKRSFGLEPSRKKALEEYKYIVDHHSDIKKYDIDSLADWLTNNQHAKIVTDVKENNIEALAKITKDYPELQSRFIPQVYQPVKHFEAKILGYKDII